MATATRKTVTVTQPVYEERVVLDLSADEAQFLADIVSGHVNGIGRRRQLNTSIYVALRLLGLDRGGYCDLKGMVSVSA